MKNVVVLIFALLWGSYLRSQTIHLLPTPDTSSYRGASGPFIVYNDNLYTHYTNSSGIGQLMQYNDCASKLIPNPDSVGKGEGFSGYSFIYNNNLYLSYLNSDSVYQLAKFDGTNITLIPNPDPVSLYYGGFAYSAPIVYNNILFFEYVNAKGIFQIAKFDGTSITLIPNPDSSKYGCNGRLFNYNGIIGVEYKNSAGYNQLAIYDNNKITLIPNPDAGSGVSYLEKDFNEIPTPYNGKMYFLYQNVNKINQLAEFDGTTLKLIPNPSLVGLAPDPSPIIYNGKLYLRFQINNMLSQMAVFDGNALSLIPNIDASKYGYGGEPIIFNGNLFFNYVTASGPDQLGKFDGNTISLIPNPDGGTLVGDPWKIIFDNKLYCIYNPGVGAPYSYIYQLFQYDGTKTSLIANPDSPNVSEGYSGVNAIYHGKLFILYNNKEGFNQLGYLGDTIPAVAIITTSPSSSSICIGQTVTFNVTIDSSYKPVFNWQKNGQAVGVNSPKYIDSTLKNMDKIDCILTIDNGCTDTTIKSDTITIGVNLPMPITLSDIGKK